MHGQVNDMVTSSAGAATCLGLVLLDLVWEVIAFAVCSNIIVQHVIWVFDVMPATGRLAIRLDPKEWNMEIGLSVSVSEVGVAKNPENK